MLTTEECVVRERGLRYVNPKCVLFVLESMRTKIKQYLNERGKVPKKLLKEYFIVSFLFFTGARVGEFREIRRRDIKLSSQEAVIPTLKQRSKKKGVRDIRVITLSHIPLYVLELWELYLNQLDMDDRVITLHHSNIYRTVKRVFERYNIKNVAPHMLRHAIAIFLATEGELSESRIADFLGHSKIENVAIYTRLARKEVRLLFSRIREKFDIVNQL